MAVVVEDDTGPTFYSDGESLTLTKANSDNVFINAFVSRDSTTGRTLTTHDYGSESFVNDETIGATALLTQQIYHVVAHILDGNIPETAQTLDIGWSGVQDEDGNGVGLLLSGVDQTTPFVDQSGTAGIQFQAFESTITDLTYTAEDGDIVVYVIMNNDEDPGTITGWQKPVTGQTGDSLLDLGAAFYKILTSDETDVTVNTPIASGSGNDGYHFVFVIKAASGVPSLIVQSLAQAQSIDQPGLTQAHLLVSNDLTQSQSIDQPTLTQANILATNDLDQNQTVDQPTLTQINSLTPNDIDQAQSIDQPTLTQASILSTNDIDQSQSIDSPTLTQAHVLTVNDLTQSQTIDNVTLAVAGALLVDDLTQSQTIDLANIIQSHILSVNGLTQNQSIDQPSLVTGITVNDITQAQSLDIPTLTQANILSVDSLTQAQLIDNVSFGGVVVGFHKGEILVFSAYNGIITSTNAHTGEVKVFNAVDLT